MQQKSCSNTSVHTVYGFVNITESLSYFLFQEDMDDEMDDPQDGGKPA